VIASEGINNKKERETKLIERDYRNIDKLAEYIYTDGGIVG